MSEIAAAASGRNWEGVSSAWEESRSPSRWWETPSRSCILKLLVVMSRPLQTCILSELMISTGSV